MVTNSSDLLTSSKGWGAVFGGGAKNIQGTLSDNSNTTNDTLPASGQPLKYDQWTMVALTVDRTAKVGKLTVGIPGNVQTFSADITSLSDLTSGLVTIGNDGTGQFNVANFVGQVDDLSIWTRPLTDAELAEINTAGQAGTPLSGLLTPITLPSGATATLNADNTITYTPLGRGQTATDSFTYTDMDTNGLVSNPATVSVSVSGVTPVVTDPNISISGATGTGGVYRIGDTVTATWNNTAAGDNNPGVTGVTVDFSQFGGGSAVNATDSNGIWTATYKIVAGSLNGVPNRNVSVTADSPGGNVTGADTTNATVDNVAPTVSISDNVNGGPLMLGETITYTATFSEPVSGVEAGDFSNFGSATGPSPTSPLLARRSTRSSSLPPRSATRSCGSATREQ